LDPKLLTWRDAFIEGSDAFLPWRDAFIEGSGALVVGQFELRDPLPSREFDA
jgi:hypothetical protein